MALSCSSDACEILFYAIVKSTSTGELVINISMRESRFRDIMGINFLSPQALLICALNYGQHITFLWGIDHS